MLQTQRFSDSLPGPPFTDPVPRFAEQAATPANFLGMLEVDIITDGGRMDRERRRLYWHLGVGIFLVVIGTLMLLDRFNIIYVGSVWHFWPVILLAVGLARLADAQERHEYRSAFFWLFFGSWFLASELHLFGLSYHNSWPLLLIGWGVSILMRTGPEKQHHSEETAHGN